MKKYLVLIITMMLGVGILVDMQAVAQPAAVPVAAEKPVTVYQVVNALDIVARPNFYFNKNVTIKAKFDKFSTLGLDYKPAMRSSDDYISFLIQRPDVKDHVIPLSELKIFMKRKDAEKYVDLGVGDDVEFSGRIFSTALGNPWMDVNEFKVINSKQKTSTAAKK
jgi:hypothetical protein